MKSLLSRWHLRPRIGLVVDETQISLSVVALTLRGRREISRVVRSCDQAPREAVLREILAPWLGQANHPEPGKAQRRRVDRRPWVHIALPEARVFQSIVPISSANRAAAPQAFFMEAVQSTNLRPEDRYIDLVKLEINKQPMACLAASPRLPINELIETLSALGARVALVEAAPAALFRAGVSVDRGPRGSKLGIRFFLGRSQGIGILAASGQPLFWHVFDLSPDDPTSSIMATYSTLWMQGRHARISLPIDSVIIHGRPDLKLALDADTFRSRTGAGLLRRMGPDQEPAAAARGVALANPLVENTGLDLARGVKPPVPIREIIPWGELCLQGALMAGVSLFLNAGALDVETQLRSTSVELSTFAWLKNQDQGQLEKEKAGLEERAKLLEAFRGNRIDWSSQIRTIAEDMPASTLVTAFQGTSEGLTGGKSQMIVNFATPMPDEGSMPREINEFLNELRVEPALRKSFPTIDVSGLRANPTRGNQPAQATYSVVCASGGNARSGPPKAGAAPGPK